MSEIKLIALDLDGTLFCSDGSISSGSIDAINYAAKKGVHVVISTGRCYAGLPFERLEDTDMNYAITTNGSAVYRLHPKECLFESPMDDHLIIPVLKYLDRKDIIISAFIRGERISPEPAGRTREADPYSDSGQKPALSIPEFINYMLKNDYHIDKITIDFKRMADGTLKDRDDVASYCEKIPGLEVVCGGFNNVELTKKGVDKGLGLLELAKHLHVSPEETMAIGDSGNDVAILKAAGVGVAMDNADDDTKKYADFITASNDDDGVAKAIYKFVR